MKILIIGDVHGELKKLKKELPKHDFDFVVGVGDYAGVEEWRKYIDYWFRIKDRKKAKSPKEFYGNKKFRALCLKDYHAGKDTLGFLESLGKPGVFVFGNGDDEWYDVSFIPRLKAKKRQLNFLKKLRSLKNINYKHKKIRSLEFLGFGGYMDVSANEGSRDPEWQDAVDKRMEKAEKKFEILLKKVGKGSIFVFHYPPLGVFDKIKDKKNPFNGKSSGIDFFRRAILKKKPSLVLCGHMEEYQGKKKLGSSVVVNPGKGSKGLFAIVDFDENKKKVRSVGFYGR